MDLKTKQLNRLKDNETLVDIFRDTYEESQNGFIIDFNEEFLLMEKFNTNAQHDGISVLKMENISRIRWGGNDNESSIKLIDQSKRFIDIGGINLESWNTILESISKKYNHVNVFIEDQDSDISIIGVIKNLDDDTLIINEFGTPGRLDRSFIMIALDDITKVEAAGIYENNLLKLYSKQ